MTFSRRVFIGIYSLYNIWFSELEHESEELLVQLYNCNLLGSDDFMGQCLIPIRTLFDSLLHDRYFKLTPRKKETVSGEVRLRLHYTSAKVTNFISSGIH